jgi:hypothetical protein
MGTGFVSFSGVLPRAFPVLPGTVAFLYTRCSLLWRSRGGSGLAGPPTVPAVGDSGGPSPAPPSPTSAALSTVVRSPTAGGQRPAHLLPRPLVFTTPGSSLGGTTPVTPRVDTASPTGETRHTHHSQFIPSCLVWALLSPIIARHRCERFEAVQVIELRLGFSNTTRNPEGITTERVDVTTTDPCVVHAPDGHLAPTLSHSLKKQNSRSTHT